MVGRGNIFPVLRQLGIQRVPDRAVAGSRLGAYFGVLVVAEQCLLERFPRRQVVVVRLRQFVVVSLAPLAVAQYAARVVDEAQRLFDVALAVASLGVVLADESAQRRTHFLVGRRGENAQCVVQRRLHWSPTLAAVAAALPPKGTLFAPWDGPAALILPSPKRARDMTLE